ncbi:MULTISPECIES: DUF2834 domain-containing protein [Thalassolituus]|nr:DUF2834 domain-containing protein [Thalassolituus oleivorans]MDF1640371.1 DUF2834 domain-containing protein [Thalassolituus oleivorans]
MTVRYIAVLGRLFVGVSFGLPLYLYFREKQSLESQSIQVMYSGC